MSGERQLTVENVVMIAGDDRLIEHAQGCDDHARCIGVVFQLAGIEGCDTVDATEKQAPILRLTKGMRAELIAPYAVSMGVHPCFPRLLIKSAQSVPCA